MDLSFLDYKPVLAWLSTTGVQLIIILAGMLLLSFVLSKTLRGIEKGFKKTISNIESVKRLDTLFSVMRLVVKTVILGIGVMMILSELGLDLGPLLATVGVLGLAVSFGAQTMVKDLISGVFILIEDKIRVGDVITANGLTGKVESIQLRTVVLRAINGDLHVIPNGSIVEFTNMTKDFSRALWNIGVGYSEDVDHVISVIEEEGKSLIADQNFSSLITSDLTILGLQEMADSAIVIRCMLDTLPGEQWGITREFNRRIKKRFDTEGIEIPFPHRTIYFGDSSDEKKSQSVAEHTAVNAMPESDEEEV